MVRDAKQTLTKIASFEDWSLPLQADNWYMRPQDMKEAGARQPRKRNTANRDPPWNLEAGDQRPTDKGPRPPAVHRNQRSNALSGSLRPLVQKMYAERRKPGQGGRRTLS